MIAGLIGTPSVSSTDPRLDMGNREVIELLAGWLDTLGFRVETLPVDAARGKFNLIGTLGAGSGGLVLAGHTDTVPWDEHRWHHDPFRLTEANARLYGLGTSDMKSFLALALEAARGLDPRTLKQPLVILATADEETSMAGARTLEAKGTPPGRYAIIGEPTGMRPVRMHKGMMMEAIHIEGRSGHSSDPALGESALEAMHRVIGELLAWRTELQAANRDAAFAVPFPTLNLGHIHGGDNPNRICGACELQLDLRPLPDMDVDALRSTLQERVRAALQDTAVQVRFGALFEGVPAMQTDPNSKIICAAEALTGHPAGAVAFGTEGPHLNRLGTETVVLGPGDIAQAHQPDEFLALDRVEPMVALLKKFIRRFCIDG